MIYFLDSWQWGWSPLSCILIGTAKQIELTIDGHGSRDRAKYNRKHRLMRGACHEVLGQMEGGVPEFNAIRERFEDLLVREKEGLPWNAIRLATTWMAVDEKSRLAPHRVCDPAGPDFSITGAFEPLWDSTSSRFPQFSQYSRYFRGEHKLLDYIKRNTDRWEGFDAESLGLVIPEELRRSADAVAPSVPASMGLGGRLSRRNASPGAAG